MVPIHEIATLRAAILSVVEPELFMNIATFTTGLAGWEPFVNPDNMFAFPCGLVVQHPGEISPAIVAGGFPEMESLLDGRHVQVLDTDIICEL